MDLRYFHLRRSAIAALLALTLLPVRCAWADSDLEKQIKFDYSDKVLTLRHFYSGEHLRFQSDGTLEGDTPVGPWTLDGQIDVEDVHLHGAQLVIKGRRIHRVVDPQNNLIDELMTVENARDKQQKDLEKDLRHLKVEIGIELPSDKPDQKDISAAMHAVFLFSSDSMLDVVPSYWRAYIAKREGKPQSAAEPTKEIVYVNKPGGAVTPPHVNYNPDPEYSDQARKAKYQGTAVVSLVVDASGTAKDLQIQKPLGLGLDEKAIAAISSWKFDPALKNGEPVPVAIMVEVTFRLY